MESTSAIPALVAIAALLAAPAPASDFILAERGKPAECAIVVAGDAGECVQYAAQELRHFVRETTGVELPIVAVATAVATEVEGQRSKVEGQAMGGPDAELPRKAIVLERLEGLESLDALENRGNLTLRGGGPDAFRLHVEGERLRIAGGGGRGVLYGVYEVLERFAGCRWYSSWHSRIPTLGRIALPGDLDETQSPAFEMREPFWYDVRRHPEFEARLRANGHKWGGIAAKYGGDDFRFGGGLASSHTFDVLLPPDKYFAKHPEYYCMVDGERTLHGSRRWGGWQPCLSNPDVLRIVTSNLLERMRKDPGARFYGVSQMDNDNWCDCPACRAIDEEEGSHAGTVVRFVNAVAEAVEKEFPDAIVETLAYHWSRKPPKTRLRHNVTVCLCTSGCDYAEPLPSNPYRKNVEFLDDIVEWGRQTDRLYVWDYTTDFRYFAIPFPNAYALQDNIRFFRDNGVRFLFEQGDHVGFHADFAELKAWLLAKWMWNPELPMRPLLDDFFEGYYGAGAPFVREWFEAVHAAELARPRPDGPDDERFMLGTAAEIDNPAISDDLLARGAALFRQAMEATADDPATSYNVRMAAFAVDFLRLERMQPRPDKLLWLASRPPKETAYDLVEASRLAQSLLDRMDEARARLGGAGIALSEDLPRRHRRLVNEWRRLAALAGAIEPTASGVVEERDMALYREGSWGRFADDPLAGDGRAVRLSGTHVEWAVQFELRNIEFEPGATYRLRARIRVEKAPGADGTLRAFNTGVYDPVAKEKRGAIEPLLSDVGEGYAWFDIATWEPVGREYFYLAPPAFDPDGKSPVGAVWLDKLEISRLD